MMNIHRQLKKDNSTSFTTNSERMKFAECLSIITTHENIQQKIQATKQTVIQYASSFPMPGIIVK
jgi:hypothetical protein